MVSAETQELARRAEDLYERRLRELLEKTHHGFFVSIEPDSGDYFLGRSLDEAIERAQEAKPNRALYTRRIGFPGAFEIGYAHDDGSSG